VNNRFRGSNSVYNSWQHLQWDTNWTRRTVNNRFRGSNSVYNSWQHLQWDTNWTRRTVNNRFRGYNSVYNSWQQMQWDTNWTGGRVNICTYFVFETKIYLSRGGNESGNRLSDANFLTVFRSNYGTILLSFHGMITGQKDNWPTSAIISYQVLKGASYKKPFNGNTKIKAGNTKEQTAIKCTQKLSSQRIPPYWYNSLTVL